MKKETIDGKTYHLPNDLTPFQKGMYIHLINWKWNKLGILEPGIYKYNGETLLYDAILPKSVHEDYPIIYKPILNDLLNHKRKFPFKLHLHFNHMASSQAANVNLFLPILLSSSANEIIRQLKTDFKNLATEELYKGFRIEFWGGNGREKGLLRDHNARSGTDSDIAIAYHNHQGELCLWLIEHKLTEIEFTDCNASRSNGRNIERHNCNNSFSKIIEKKSMCYYHDVRKTNYWNLSERNQSFFVNHHHFDTCPFKGGMNQLWRNQLLALALEEEGKYKHVYFLVVRHPGNKSLDNSISEYKKLVGYSPKFSDFTSDTIIEIVRKIDDQKLNRWADWYENLYKL